MPSPTVLSWKTPPLIKFVPRWTSLFSFIAALRNLTRFTGHKIVPDQQNFCKIGNYICSNYLINYNEKAKIGARIYDGM